MLLSLLPALILALGLARFGGWQALAAHSGFLGWWGAWSGTAVLLARSAAGEDGAWLMASAGSLAAAGLIVTLTAGPARLAAHGLLWVAASALALVLSVLPWEELVQAHRRAAVGTLLALLIPLVAGTEVGGTRAWLRWGTWSLQPAELAKAGAILFLAGRLAPQAQASGGLVAGRPASSTRGHQPQDPKRLGEILDVGAFWCLVTAGFVLQRDLGSGAVVFLLLPAGLLLAGWNWRPLMAVLGLAGVAGWACIPHFPHAVARVEAWQGLWRLDPASAYQVWQGLASLALGGLWGRPAGFGEGLPVPAAATDLPLAIIAPGAGLVAVWGILYLQWFIVDKGLGAARASGGAARVLVGLAAVLWGLEALVPTAGWLGLLPLTGLPLPLVSRGGTALITHGILLGWLLWGLRRSRAELLASGF